MVLLSILKVFHNLTWLLLIFLQEFETHINFKCLFMVGAKQPDYLVTADDVDAYLAIEVQPLDDRKRKVVSFLSI